MTKTKRIAYMLMGILMLLCSGLLLAYPQYGCNVVALILELSLVLRGLQLLFYYVTMARFMVGGISTLYRGLIVLDLGLFAVGLQGAQIRTTMLYLIACLMFSGVVDILKARDARTLERKTWRYTLITGLLKVLVGVLCLFHLDSTQQMAMIYSLGLVHAAIYRIVSAFRKNAVIYME